MTSLELFEHRYNKGQKFSWLEMLDFAEAYASQSPEPKECPKCKELREALIKVANSKEHDEVFDKMRDVGEFMRQPYDAAYYKSKGEVPPEPNTVTDSDIKQKAKKHSEHIPDKQHRLWQHAGFLLGARWALHQTQAVGVSEDEIIDILTRLVDLKIYKDKYGKDDLYLKEQPILWEKARSILELLNQKK